MNKTIALAAALLPFHFFAQNLTEHEVDGLEPIIYGEVIWLDKDNDGRHELTLCGASDDYDHHAQFFNNIGTNVLDGDESFEMEGLSLASADKADFNNDGFMDFVMTGFNGDLYVTNLYLNNGDGTFEMNQLDIIGTSSGKIRTGDFNGDERTDIVLTGIDSTSNYVAKLFFQNESGDFIDQEADLMANYFGDISVFDADNDGDNDLLITGFDLTYVPNTAFYLNDGSGVMVRQEETGLPNVYFSGSATADIDNDGDLDLLLNGMTDSYVPHTGLYLNGGSGLFTIDETVELTALYFGTANFVDVNADEKVDIFISGSNGDGITFSEVYLQSDEGVLLNDELSDTIIDVNISTTAWEDYDADGDMDLMISGFTFEGDRLARLYTNDLFEPTYTSLDAQDLSPEFNVYPNPNKGLFTVEVYTETKSELTVLNMQGQDVLHQFVSKGQTLIELNQIEAGLYIAILQDKNGISKKMLTINK